jgi:hypothetical protein
MRTTRLALASTLSNELWKKMEPDAITVRVIVAPGGTLAFGWPEHRHIVPFNVAACKGPPSPNYTRTELLISTPAGRICTEMLPVTSMERETSAPWLGVLIWTNI